MRTVMKIFLTLVGVGLAVALLRAFNFDVFAVFTWAWDWAVNIINHIADWFSDNQAFQKATKAPSVISGTVTQMFH